MTTPVLHRLDEVALIEMNTIEGMIWLIKDRASVREAVDEMVKALNAKIEYRAKLMTEHAVRRDETETPR